MFTKTGVWAQKVPLRDEALRESDARCRILADISASAMFTCWGERLMLRMADCELYRMKKLGKFSEQRETA
jgi:hypothetical protein